MYNTHEDLPTSVSDYILTVSGESDIKKVSMEDINNLINDMKEIYGDK